GRRTVAWAGLAAGIDSVVGGGGGTWTEPVLSFDACAEASAVDWPPPSIPPPSEKPLGRQAHPAMRATVKIKIELDNATGDTALPRERGPRSSRGNSHIATAARPTTTPSRAGSPPVGHHASCPKP